MCLCVWKEGVLEKLSSPLMKAVLQEIHRLLLIVIITQLSKKFCTIENDTCGECMLFSSIIHQELVSFMLGSVYKRPKSLYAWQNTSTNA